MGMIEERDYWEWCHCYECRRRRERWRFRLSTAFWLLAVAVLTFLLSLAPTL